MSKQKKLKIGNVPLYTSRPLKKYEDKGTEDDLLELFQSSEPEVKRLEVLANEPSWPMFYHLTPLRRNLLCWYNFSENSSVLEVGAGCGGVTETLIEKNIKVTALELSDKRALINAERNKKSQKLEVMVGNLQDFNPDKKFDYVVCVGVLEYAGTFIDSESPYTDFLKMLSHHLKPDGKLLLAIENRLGLKYWTGAKEDHVHSFFEGHNGYPGNPKMQTFGRKELKELLSESGFSDSYFYYPFPDYKTPVLVYSDHYYPGNGAEFPLSRLPTPTFDRAREQFASEQNLMRYIEKNNLFQDFSNSFLVEATR